jgi:23S rRNA (adenine2503-C2)-methyltransferase
MLVQDQLPEGESVSNIVVMGMGEPTMNLAALLRALELWNHPQALGLGARRITISTVGYPAKIRRLAETGKEFGLAVSLHAADRQLREKLLPGAGRIDLQELLQATREFFRVTGRRVTFEYTLLRGLNDAPEQALLLAQLLHGQPCAVNLIPVNPVEGLPYQRPPQNAIDQFRNLLRQQGVHVTRRRTRGDDIAGACGQLRLQELRAK